MDWSYSREFRNHIYVHSLNTKTLSEQAHTEEVVNDTYYQKKEDYKDDFKKLFNVIHVKFSKSKLLNLSEVFESLDASQTWLIYWSIHSLKLLNFTLPEDIKQGVIDDIASCQNSTGGFGGGPMQLSHLATTYGAVLALVELESADALKVINRQMLRKWLSELHLKNGAFKMHVNGETDIRGCYCAVIAAKLTGIYCDELFAKTAEWIASCQTYEGGFAGAPGLEAHGGYTFCALAALILLNGIHLIDLELLLKWTVFRQMSCEGGFQGRTNKLVDSCYSFWVGAAIPLIQSCLSCFRGKDILFPLYDTSALEEYILVCCQNLLPPVSNPNGGGIIDKPGKHADPYHTCYALSGLSVCQHYQKELNRRSMTDLENVDILCNVTRSALKFCDSYFSNL